MRELLKKDITIKIFSVLIAVLLWLIVYNASNPYGTMTFANIPLKIENTNYLDDNGYIVKNKYRTSVDITIRGRQDVIDKVRPTDFEAVLDFSQIKSLSDKAIKISEPTCSQKDVSIESYTPAQIDVQLARNISGTFQVELIDNMTLKPGYKVLKTTVSPDTIPIMNEESLVDSISSIRATLDAKDVDSDFTQKVNCKVYNADGKEIPSLSRDLTVNVSVAVAKEVPLTLVTRGKPADDYVETQSSVTPDTALITGSPEVLGKISDIKTEPVNIDNLDKNLAVPASVVLPSGVKLANAPKDFSVSITVEKLVLKDMTLAAGDIQLANTAGDGSLNYEVVTQNIPLQLKGRLLDLAGVSIDSLKPTVDVSGLAEGTHKLPLNISLPSSVKLMQDVLVDVKISKPAVPPAT